MAEFNGVVGISAPKWRDDSATQGATPHASHNSMQNPMQNQTAQTTTSGILRSGAIHFRENLRMAQEGIVITLAALDALNEALDILEALHTRSANATSGHLDSLEREHADIDFARERHQLTVLAASAEVYGQPLFRGSFKHWIVLTHDQTPDETFIIALPAIDAASLHLTSLTINTHDAAVNSVQACAGIMEEVGAVFDDVQDIQDRLDLLLCNIDEIVLPPFAPNRVKPSLDDAADRVRATCDLMMRMPDLAFDSQANLLRLDSNSLVRPLSYAVA